MEAGVNLIVRRHAKNTAQHSIDSLDRSIEEWNERKREGLLGHTGSVHGCAG